MANGKNSQHEHNGKGGYTLVMKIECVPARSKEKDRVVGLKVLWRERVVRPRSHTGRQGDVGLYYTARRRSSPWSCFLVKTDPRPSCPVMTSTGVSSSLHISSITGRGGESLNSKCHCLPAADGFRYLSQIVSDVCR